MRADGLWCGRTAWVLVLAWALVWGLLMPSTPVASAAGEPVIIGAIFDLSGPTSDIGTPYAHGVTDHVTWYNATKGEDAPPVDLRWADFGYKVPEAERLYGQYVSEGAWAFIGWGTADTEALRTRANADEVPFMSAAYPEPLTDPAESPYNFVDGMTYSDQMRIALQWIAAQEAGQHAEVAVLHHDSPFGMSPVQDGRDYIAEHSLDLGYQAYRMPAGAVDYTAELEQAKAQGAKYIVVQNVASVAAKLAQNAADTNYDMRLVCLNWCADEIFAKLAGPAAEGAVGVMPFAPPSADTAGMQEMRQFVAARGDNLDKEGVHYIQGWYTAAAMVAAAEAAAAAGEVTGPAIRQQLETSPGVATGDVTSEPIRFRPESHKGMTSARLFTVEGGRWVRPTDALTP